MLTFSLKTAARRIRRGLGAITGTTRIYGVRVSTDKRRVPPLVRHLLFAGSYERAESRLVQRYFQPGDRVLEIGGGTGLIGILAQKVTARAVMICEANPDAIPLIHENFRLNGLTPQIVAQAVTADGRDVVFYQDHRLVGSSLLDRRKGDGNFQPRSMSSTPLNRLIATHAPDALLMDVEGAEVELLNTADLSGIRTIIFEQHPWIVAPAELDALHKTLVERGFERVGETGDTCCYCRSARQSDTLA